MKFHVRKVKFPTHCFKNVKKNNNKRSVPGFNLCTLLRTRNYQRIVLRNFSGNFFKKFTFLSNDEDNNVAISFLMLDKQFLKILEQKMI